VLTNTNFASPWFGHANAHAMQSLVKHGLASAENYEHFQWEQTRLAAAGQYFYAISAFAYVGNRNAK
jgi:hypothetical protein